RESYRSASWLCGLDQLESVWQRLLLFLSGVMSKKSVFALVQLCCRTAALRPSLLQPQPPVHLAAARSGFPGPASTTTTPPRGHGGPQTRSIATGFVLPLHAHLGGGDGRAMSAARCRRQAAGRAAGTTTTTAAAVLAATLLLSSPSGA
ncbi:unnamed protein product, partial [Ectocarpus sp. 12 AP-2014]